MNPGDRSSRVEPRTTTTEKENEIVEGHGCSYATNLAEETNDNGKRYGHTAAGAKTFNCRDDVEDRSKTEGVVEECEGVSWGHCSMEERDKAAELLIYCWNASVWKYVWTLPRSAFGGKSGC